MADRVPLPRVSTAYAAATAAPAAETGVFVPSGDADGTLNARSTSTSSAPTSASTSTNPLDAPVARAALLTMASELTVLDTLGFLSGPVSGKDFSAPYRCVQFFFFLLRENRQRNRFFSIFTCRRPFFSESGGYRVENLRAVSLDRKLSFAILFARACRGWSAESNLGNGRGRFAKKPGAARFKAEAD